MVLVPCVPSASLEFKVHLARNKNAEGFPESNGLARPGVVVSVSKHSCAQFALFRRVSYERTLRLKIPLFAASAFGDQATNCKPIEIRRRRFTTDDERKYSETAVLKTASTMFTVGPTVVDLMAE